MRIARICLLAVLLCGAGCAGRSQSAQNTATGPSAMALGSRSPCCTSAGGCCTTTNGCCESAH